MQVMCVVGARPNFVKIAPILRAFRAIGHSDTTLLHTGQHYDVAMNTAFFDELAIPAPDINLEIGSGTGTQQTARIMLALEDVLTARRPDVLLVVGDVNSTLATALVGAKLRIPLVHVEAGLRSNDLAMPEEINRLVTDRLSSLLLATEPSAVENLVREGVPTASIRLVGNVMIDTLHACLPRAVAVATTLSATDCDETFMARIMGGYGFVTLHRPSNVDEPKQLRGLVEALASISQELPLIFAVHPRTRAAIAVAGLDAALAASSIHVTPPLTYLQTIGVMRDARVVLTDSGGVQEETTALGVPCLTIRDNTERPITVSDGTNMIVGSNPAALAPAVTLALRSDGKRGRVPDLWDGRAAERVVQAVREFFAPSGPRSATGVEVG